MAVKSPLRIRTKGLGNIFLRQERRKERIVFVGVGKQRERFVVNCFRKLLNSIE
jgi:hypothetical protein